MEVSPLIVALDATRGRARESVQRRTDRLPGRRVGLEILGGGKLEEAGDEDAGYGLRARVVDLDGAVVIVPGVGDLVFGVREISVELGELLVGLEVRVRLDQRKQTSARMSNVT